MKRIWMMILMIAFVVCWGHGSPTMAALDPPGDVTGDRWFSVDNEEEPFVEGIVSSYDDSDSQWWGTYYQNDQTFLIFSHNESMTDIVGSYLWDSGFFLGLQYEKADDGEANLWAISPGYRWNLDRGYIAFSLDYKRQTQNAFLDYDVKAAYKGLELSWVYYPNNMKIKTDIQWTKADATLSIPGYEQFAEMDAFYLDPMVNFKVTDNLVVGVFGSYRHADQKNGMRDEDGEVVMSRDIEDHEFGMGFTWELKGFILNARAQKEKDQDGESISSELIIPIMNNLQFGLEYSRLTSEDDDGLYDNDTHGFTLQYRFKEDYELYLYYGPEDDVWRLGIHRDL